MYSKGQLTINGALLHGLFAVIGVVLLIISVVQGKTTRIDNYALILFIIAALGGLVLIYNHLTKGKLPQAIIGIHAIVAVIAFLMLLSGNVGR
jgi:disulfide bond formation protein DsbB